LYTLSSALDGITRTRNDVEHSRTTSNCPSGYNMLVFDSFKSRNASPTEHYSRTIKERIHQLANPVSMPDPNRRKYVKPAYLF
jgi:hypothetical protein